MPNVYDNLTEKLNAAKREKERQDRLDAWHVYLAEVKETMDEKTYKKAVKEFHQEFPKESAE